MSSIHRALFVFVLATAFLAAHTTSGSRHEPSSIEEEQRLLGVVGAADCWSALLDLRSCSNEIVLFFLNGERSHLGPECCDAVRVITRHCWSSMLTSLGLTAEEGDILRGYCDPSSAAAPLPHPPSAAPTAGEVTV